MAMKINNVEYNPTPRDMMLALEIISNAIKELTGKTPDIKVGSRKVHPSRDGQPMDQETAKATYSALSGEKGTIKAIVGKNLVFKQQDGEIKTDIHNVKAAIAPAPMETSAETLATTVSQEPIVYPGLDNEMVKAPLPDYNEAIAPSEPQPAELVDNAVAPEPEPAIAPSEQQKDTPELQIENPQAIYNPNVDPSMDPMQRQQEINEELGLPEVEPGQAIDETPILSPDFDPDSVAQVAHEVAQEMGASVPLGAQDAIAAAQANVDRLKANLANANAQLQAMKTTLEAMSHKSNIPNFKEMAAKAARSTIDSIQNRAKASVFKAANLGYQMAQKALDKVGEQLGKKESELLKFADITSAIIKTCDHFQSDRIQEGNYTFAKTQDGVSVVSNDGKEIYKADSQGAKFTGGVKDYDMLAKVKAAIEAVANPAAIAVEILKNEALKTVQQEGQKSAVKL